MSQESKKNIGEIIAQARERSGLSLRKVAARLPINFAYLADIEKGRRMPSEKVIKGLSEVEELQLDFDELMALSGRLGDEAEKYMADHPAFGRFVRKLARRNLTDEQLDVLEDYINKKSPG